MSSQLAFWRQWSPEVRQYGIITGNYWVFTLSDGALRMLVLLHFYQLGYQPLQLAMLFLFYEFFGVVTNLLGGWLGARIGLNRTMNLGLLLQVLALSLLLVPTSWLTVPWVMAAQALSGIAKDLNKMSAKSAIKVLSPKDKGGRLYAWVAFLTGSKNTLKGAGYFLGGLLLGTLGFQGAMAAMASALLVTWVFSLWWLKADMGKAKQKPKFSALFAKERSLNLLAGARLFLFAARDVWFVVALPVYLASVLGWSHSAIGGFFALWIMGYGAVQALTPRWLKPNSPQRATAGWAWVLAIVPTLLIAVLTEDANSGLLIGGLLLFGAVFAVNSALHSYLIVAMAREDGVSLDVGFYYMANALGRLFGTVGSGWAYQQGGLPACLGIALGCLLVSGFLAWLIPPLPQANGAEQDTLSANGAQRKQET